MTATVATLNELAAVWAPLIWRACWQGGIALLLALALSHWAPKYIPAHVKCWAWRLAFFKLLIAGLWIVPLEFRVLPPAAPAVEIGPSAVAGTPLPVLASSRQAPGSNVAPGLSGLGWLLVAWILGVALCIANQVRHWAHARRMIAGLAPVTDRGVLNRLAESCRQMGVGRPPELRVSDTAGTPFLVGMLRPIVVIPAVVSNTCSAAELNAALAHELAHVKRRDLFWNCLPALAEVIFFFHPLVWLAKREWRLTQEVATDQLAIAASQGNVARYAQSLIDLVARCPTVANCPRHAVCVSEAYSQLSKRIIAMHAFQEFSPRRRLALAVAVLTIAVIGVAPWKLTAQATESQSQPAAAAEDKTVDDRTAQDKSAQDGPPADAEPAERSITIHVVDADGKPMKGVKVFRNHAYKLVGEERPKIENKDYFTDEEGKAVVALSGITLDLRLWATREKFFQMHAMWAKAFQPDGDQIPQEFTFTLKPGTEIGGVVKNEKGEPIEGVKVEIVDESVMMTNSRPDPKKLIARPVRQYWLASQDEALVTDAQGRWSLATVAPDEELGVTDGDGESPLMLRVSHPDYVSSKEPGRAQREQGVRHKSLRDKTATIVMYRKPPQR